MNPEVLTCNASYSDDITIRSGRMSFCMIYGRPHFFILVEETDTRVKKKDRKRIAFSYVPESSYLFLKNKYENAVPFKYKEDVNDWVSGYLLWKITDSYVLDSYMLTDQFVRLKSKKIKNWSFQRYPEFSKYNVATVIPICGVTDCIGYSSYHYEHT